MEVERDYQAERIQRVTERRRRDHNNGQDPKTNDDLICRELVSDIIRRSVQESNDLETVIQKLELSVESFNLLCLHSPVVVPPIERIKLAVRHGAYTGSEISRKTGFSEKSISHYCTLAGKGIRKVVREHKADILEQELEKGVDSIRELIEKTGFSFSVLKTLSKYVELPFDLEGLEWHDFFGMNRVEGRDKLIDQGLSMAEIARREGMTNQGVQEYIKGSGQHDEWKKKRKEIKRDRGPTLSIIASQINEVARRQIPEENLWAYDKANEYLSKKRPVGFDSLFELFKRYNRAKNNGKKVSLEKLGEGLGKGFNFPIKVSNILKRVGLGPFYGTWDRRAPLSHKEATRVKKSSYRRRDE